MHDTITETVCRTYMIFLQRTTDGLWVSVRARLEPSMTEVSIAESTEAKLSGDRNGGDVRSRYGHMNPLNNNNYD
jgi:hypothetical protein